MKKIASPSLRSTDVPRRGAPWRVIEKFALTFDGYKHWGSFARCAEIANAQRRRTLNELRTCLFFEQRRWHHFGADPDRKAMRYIRSLIEEMRGRLGRREKRST